MLLQKSCILLIVCSALQYAAVSADSVVEISLQDILDGNLDNDVAHHHQVAGDNFDKKPIMPLNEYGPDEVQAKPGRRIKRKVYYQDENKTPKLWPDHTVYYKFEDPKLSTTHRSVFADAVKQWTDVTCLNFVETTDANKLEIKVTTWEQTYSHASLGWAGAWIGQELSNCQHSNGSLVCEAADLQEFQIMEISLDTDRINPGLVAHEIGHAFGLKHEQSRVDRDQYLDIIESNIQSNSMSNFDVGVAGQQWDNFTIDFGSIMCYYANIFAIDNSKTTMEAKDKNYIATLGTSSKVSFIDSLEVNQAYNCLCDGDKALETSDVTCLRGGYLDVNKCAEQTCMCPSGFGGATCDVVETTADGGYLLADDTWAQLKVNTIPIGEPYRAVYQIRAPEGQKVEILLKYVGRSLRTSGLIVCQKDYVEFKLGRDVDGHTDGKEWRPTGYRFCDMAQAQYLHSEGRDAIVMLNIGSVWDGDETHSKPYTNLYMHYRAVDAGATLPDYTIPDVLPQAEVTYDANAEPLKSQLTNFVNQQTDSCCGYFAKVSVTSADGSSVSSRSTACDSTDCASAQPEPQLTEKEVLKVLPTEATTKTTTQTTTTAKATTTATTTEKATTTVEATTTEKATTTVEATTTEKATTTVKATTTEKATTTVEATTTEKATTTVEATTTEKATTTVEATTTEKATTTVEPMTTEKATTTVEATTTAVADTYAENVAYEADVWAWFEKHPGSKTNLESRMKGYDQRVRAKHGCSATAVGTWKVINGSRLVFSIVC